MREEWLDYIAPQVYWNIGFAPADYAELVPWWSARSRGTDVQLYIGQATYKVGISTQDPAWHDPQEMTRHLLFNRDLPAGATATSTSPPRTCAPTGSATWTSSRPSTTPTPR